MKLEILSPARRLRVQPSHIVDYDRFSADFRESGESELHLLEKYYAARSLIRGNGGETFIGAIVGDPARKERQFRVDLSSETPVGITAVFCETAPPSDELIKNLGLIERSDNSRAIVLYPYRINIDALTDQLGESFDRGKIQLEQVPWGERGLERTFREALEIMDLLTNETRVRMLMPLLERPYGKRHYRSEINPKLVYENLSSLLEHNLIDESDDELYNLTPVGNRILCEYLAFVEKVKRMLEEARR